MAMTRWLRLPELRPQPRLPVDHSQAPVVLSLPPSTSITAGTVFEATKLPLTVWFQGIYFMTQDKKGCSAMTLPRQFGISCNAARRMRHKLMQAMMERDREHPPGGFIQLDDACIGGERSGGKRGTGGAGQDPFRGCGRDQ